MSSRTKLFLALSLVVSLPFAIEACLRSSGNGTLWVMWFGVLVLLWSSWPRYRSPALQQACLVMSGLLVLNAVASPLLTLAVDPPSPTLAPNLRQEVRFVGDAAPGIEGPQRITTDERGHRTNGPIDYAHKPAGALRIVAFGASTTEESKLDDRKTWTYAVAERLAAETGRKVELINTALSGVRAEQNYLALRESEAWDPDIALFVLGGNDWDDAIGLAGATPFYRFMVRFRPFMFGDSVLFKAIKTVERTVVEILRRRHGPPAFETIVDDGSFYLPSRDSLSRPLKRSFRPAGVEPSYADGVHRSFDECKRRQLLCLFGDQPAAYVAGVDAGLRKRFWMTPPYADYTVPFDDMVRLARLYNDWLEAAVRDSGLPFCALAGHVPPTPEFLLDDCHLTEQGSRRIAELMHQCLIATRSPLVAAARTH